MTDIEQRTLVTRLSKAIAKQVTVQSLPILGKIKSNATLKEEDVIPLIESRFIVSTSSTSTLNNFDPNLNLDDWSYLPQNYNYYQTDALNTDSSWTIITYAKYSEVSAQSTQESMAIEILDTTGAFEITYQIGVNYQGTELRMLATIRDNTGAYHWLDAPSPGFIDISSIEIGDVFSLATSYDSVANTLTCYVNGTEVISSTPQAVLADSSLNYRVRLNNYSGSFDTKLYKDTLVFDSVLTGSEIADIQTQSVFTAAVNALTAQYIANNNISSGGGANFTITYGGEGVREFLIDIANINNISGITSAEVQTMIDDAVTTRISSNNSPLQTEQQIYIYNKTRPAFMGLYEPKDIVVSTASNSYISCDISENFVLTIEGMSNSQYVLKKFNIEPTTATLVNEVVLLNLAGNYNLYRFRDICITPDGKRFAYCIGTAQWATVVICEFDEETNTITATNTLDIGVHYHISINGTGDILTVSDDYQIREYRLNSYNTWLLHENFDLGAAHTAITSSFDAKTLIVAREVGGDIMIEEGSRTSINDSFVFVQHNMGALNSIISLAISIDGNKLFASYTGNGCYVFVKQVDNSWLLSDTITVTTAKVGISLDAKYLITGNIDGDAVFYREIPITAPIIAPNQDISFIEGAYGTLDANNLDPFGDNSLIRFYTFDTDLNSVVGTSGGIVNVSPTITAGGKFGSCMVMNGGGLETDYAYNIKDPQSYSIWFKASTAIDYNSIIDGVIGGGQQCMQITLMSDRIYLGVTAGGNNAGRVEHVSDLNDGVFHHAVVTSDGATITAYIDGVSVGTGGISGVTDTVARNANNVDSPVSIGYSGYGASMYSFNGSLDHFQLFNRALTQEEVTLLYNAG